MKKILLYKLLLLIGVISSAYIFTFDNQAKAGMGMLNVDGVIYQTGGPDPTGKIISSFWNGRFHSTPCGNVTQTTCFGNCNIKFVYDLCGNINGIQLDVPRGLRKKDTGRTRVINPGNHIVSIFNCEDPKDPDGKPNKPNKPNKPKDPPPPPPPPVLITIDEFGNQLWSDNTLITADGATHQLDAAYPPGTIDLDSANLITNDSCPFEWSAENVVSCYMFDVEAGTKEAIPNVGTKDVSPGFYKIKCVQLANAAIIESDTLSCRSNPNVREV
jgi:hypothetical protein